jgi:hypothetical protein
MAESGIKFTYLDGDPDSITSITCLSSSPKLKGTIRLNTFTNLTAFDGGDNGLQAVTGFSQLTALKRFKIAEGNSLNFNISSLPVNLEYFNVGLGNTTTGNLCALPSSINLYYNRFNNTVYNYYDGTILGFGKKVWTKPGFWLLEPVLSSGVPGMSPQHLATLIIDLSSSTWVTPPIDTIPLKRFSALGSSNPQLNLLNGSYGTQLSAAIDSLSAQGVSLFLNLTAF